MSLDINGETVKRSRSPSFPYIGLSRALERIEILFQKAKRYDIRVLDIAKDWGLAPKSSSLDRNVAAILAFGLIDDSGSGDARKIKISEVGLKILSDHRPGVKEKLLAEAALRPKLIADYAQLWKDGRPDDQISLSQLTFDGGFTEEAARIFLRVYDETIRYAQAIDFASSVGNAGAGSGADSSATVPMRDLGGDIPRTVSKQSESVTVPDGSRRAVFALEEGDVTLVFPANLSAEGFGELADYLEVFLRKAQRQKATANTNLPADDG